MTRVEPHHKRLARRLTELSFADGRISADRVGEVLQALQSRPTSERHLLLRLYKRYLAREIEATILRLEHAGPIDETTRKHLLNHFTKIAGRPLELHTQENSGLIAGLRARLGDNIYDSSVRGQLNALATQVH